MTCAKCGSPLVPGARFCQSCGSQFAEPVPISVAQPQLLPASAPITQQAWFVAASFVFCNIFGFYFLWSNKRWTLQTKAITTAGIFGVLFVVAVIGAIFDATPAGKAAARQAATQKAADDKEQHTQEVRQSQSQQASKAQHIPTNKAASVAPAKATPALDGKSIAYMLAVIEVGHADPDDKLVQAYQEQLTALKGDQDNVTERQIANVALATHDAMQRKHIDETTLSIMEAVNLSIPEGLKPGLPDEFAAYSTLREHGQTKDKAIAELHSLLTSIAHPGQ